LIGIHIDNGRMRHGEQLCVYVCYIEHADA
jgi:hypothetical protein